MSEFCTSKNTNIEFANSHQMEKLPHTNELRVNQNFINNANTTAEQQANSTATQLAPFTDSILPAA